MQRIIIGLTGLNAAGKGEIIKYLVGNKGFCSYSLSDVLREIAKKRKVKITRENLIFLGNFLRKKYGSGVLAKKVIRNIEKCKCTNIVVDSLRNTQEIKEFRKNYKKKFFLIYVTAPKKLRFKFMLSRDRDGDPKTYKKFVELEKKEMLNTKYSQQLHKCKELCDFVINNNSTLESLYHKIDKILELCKIK
ncbi:MAG: AAA family ATPase [Endomicrobia bacterium]|nr:AAA family ATPase [Endomicrobiia bacterium]